MVVFVVLVGAGISAWANRDDLKKGYEEGLTKLFTEYDRSRDLTHAVDFLQKTVNVLYNQHSITFIASIF